MQNEKRQVVSESLPQEELNTLVETGGSSISLAIARLEEVYEKEGIIDSCVLSLCAAGASMVLLAQEWGMSSSAFMEMLDAQKDAFLRFEKIRGGSNEGN